MARVDAPALPTGDGCAGAARPDQNLDDGSLATNTPGLLQRCTPAASLRSTDRAGAATVTFRADGVDHEVATTPGVWRKGTRLVDGAPDAIAASGGWTADDTLALIRYGRHS